MHKNTLVHRSTDRLLTIKHKDQVIMIFLPRPLHIEEQFCPFTYNNYIQFFSTILIPQLTRPSHLKLPDGPKMVLVALSRQAICGNVAAQRSCLAARWATYGPYRSQLDGPKIARL